ncbi:MAG: hypothetical protein A3C50_02215 [Candidatus Staskawiczbacteria bacterium RIFCSPHIGHO2_02_FULL_43_16]|uniref:VOC domain-containing protein n=1 Tax=Candidatus Staskawiczbacteria bacterium RIFCSPHIGHO2_01_FULL_41_41 TaxID=1802203 RepID=A0A1G2HWA1_9BACT|nr:MAG: hypothetical protein A2822_00585 [Candidatus Staskawiczbacteria bacterium RIFCSPHIGHO2_01_FULL_41_41]OGZ68492.1 MAG: hypothetical protein A3C50_02215 [Candidatus Staskawiczbacteria bacterium RIFCSPHIGHO2_02_FULL_43_16]OGZ74296.1 MAG: hypothetical protein A3A12_02650 [Candidatus Staskawiczbacteria bacterium RIFCSPLOWO2_01_FULL_43_17b]
MIPKYIDHIVLIVKDVNKTSEFYIKFLGKPELKNDEEVAFKIGETKLFFVLPLKEYKLNDKDSYSLNHLSFGVTSTEELREFEQVLNNAKIPNKGIRIDKYGKKEYVSFDDPDGYRIEFYNRPIEKDNATQ